MTEQNQQNENEKEKEQIKNIPEEWKRNIEKRFLKVE